MTVIDITSRLRQLHGNTLKRSGDRLAADLSSVAGEIEQLIEICHDVRKNLYSPHADSLAANFETLLIEIKNADAHKPPPRETLNFLFQRIQLNIQGLSLLLQGTKLVTLANVFHDDNVRD